MGLPRRIGLTGGIATGKTSVARFLVEDHHIPVLDADRFAREALAPGTEATQAVLSRYGPAVLTTHQPANEGTGLDRAALARRVFADPAERRWLERLVHPIVRGRFAQELESLGPVPMVVLMVPLLFEAGLEPMCTEIWVVDCGDEEEQVSRLRARDGLTEEEARQRLGAQWPMGTKLERADVVVHNRGTLADLRTEVERALAWRGPGRRVNDGGR